MRDFVNEIGLQPEHFDLLIIAVIFVGGAWAILRLYQDLTRGSREDTADLYPTPNAKNEDRP